MLLADTQYLCRFFSEQQFFCFQLNLQLAFRLRTHFSFRLRTQVCSLGGLLIDLRTPEAIELQRMVIAEAKSNPELAMTFHQAGPMQTRDMLTRFFARPDIAAQFRADIALALLPPHLLNCIMGDRLNGLLFTPDQAPTRADMERSVEQGLALFLNATLLR